MADDKTEQKGYKDYPKGKEYEIDFYGQWDCYDMPILAGIYLDCTSPRRLSDKEAEKWKQEHYVGTKSKIRWY